MDKRSKILAIAFGVAAGYALLAGVIYPTWVKPLLTIDERIAERKKDLDKLLKEDEAVQNGRLEYKQWAARVGAFDAGKVETDIRERLNRLIEKHKLADASVTPSRPVEDRKTGKFTSSITVSATGTLDSAVGFIKDAAELPHLTRVANASLSPAGGGRKGLEKDQRVTLRVPIETWVLPQHRVVGPLKPEELERPETVVRHLGRDYRKISEGKPFWDWVPPVPLMARITKPVNVEIGQAATLEGVVSGGDGEYTISWAPPEGLSDSKSLRPTVDTQKAATQSYVLSVTDGTGSTVTASTTVVVREPQKVVQQEQVKNQVPPPAPPPPKEVRKRWPDGRSKEIKMALLCNMGSERLNQFMVYNTKSKQNEYYKVGDEFDGGTLEYVHQYGGVVRWRDDYFVYPLGVAIDQGLDAAASGEYPELQRAVEAIKEHRSKQKPAKPKPAESSTDARQPSAGDVPRGDAKQPPHAPAVVEEAKPAEAEPSGVGGEMQLVPMVLDSTSNPGTGLMGPPSAEESAAASKVRPRPKPPIRPTGKPK